jgi:hypothetical protein
MITADYLFDKKIIWLGNDLICADNFPYFKSELITVLEFLGKRPFYNLISQIESDIISKGDCLWYIRLYKDNDGPRVTYYSAGEFDLEDAMGAYREHIDMGYEPLKWSDIIDIDTNTEDIFNKLNESFDNTLIGKQIWFDFPTERNDIEKVNQFLIDNGYRGLRPDNIDEFEGFIYDYDVAFFYFVQHDSPLHSEERRKPYVDYSYMNHPDPYRLRVKPNWIYYKDILEMTDTTVDIISNLNESTEQPTPKAGDFLYCHTDVVMEDSGDEEATVGKFYPIIKVSQNKNRVEILNNSKTEHVFSIDPEEDWHYSKWFTLIPRKDKEAMERFDIDDVFNKLNESFNLSDISPLE